MRKVTFTTWIAYFVLMAVCVLLSGCDHGCKQEFADQLRLVGHFEKK